MAIVKVESSSERQLDKFTRLEVNNMTILISPISFWLIDKSLDFTGFKRILLFSSAILILVIACIIDVNYSIHHN